MRFPRLSRDIRGPACEKGVALDPKYVEARFCLVEFYAAAPGVMGGSYDNAFEQAKKIKAIDPIVGHRAYAFIYSQQKKLDLAKKEYVDAIRAHPNSPKAHSYFGQHLVNVEKNYTAAFSEFETALMRDPQLHARLLSPRTHRRVGKHESHARRGGAEEVPRLHAERDHSAQRKSKLDFISLPPAASFVMRPHPDDFDDTLAAEHLIDETMLNVDPARERAGEIAYEFLKGRGRLERIGAQDFE